MLGVGLVALVARTVGRGIWFLLMLRVMRGRARPGTSHGSAHWAHGAELRRMRPRRGCADLVVGKIGRTLVAIPEHDQYEHVLLVAPTGAGKTSGVILPNLLAEPGTRSLVITDPKRELLRKSSPALRARYGEARVWALDFLDPELSRGYNPLAYVTDAATADLFAQTWVRNTGESKDAFWSNAARTLIAAAALHLVATEEITPPLIGLVDLLCGTPAEEVRAVLSDSPVPEVRRLARGFLANMAKNERLLGSVFTELPPRFICLNLPEVRAVTATNEIAFARLAAEPIALYLALDPQHSRTLAPLTACFFLHLFTTLTAIAKREPSGALPVPMLAYLDEFGTVGHIPEFASRMATVRSAGIGCILVVQDLAQLTKAYGAEDADTILSNATTKLCLGRVTHDDAEYFSKLAGTTTVFSANRSATWPLLLPWADRGNRGVGETQRPLITPDELRTMRDEVFVVAGHRDPIRARQRRYYDAPALMRLVPRPGAPDPCVSLRRATPLPVPHSDDGLPDGETTHTACGGIGHLPIMPAESALPDLSLAALASE
ncbi:MAG TPA: type IV secretory system conjugative DNA transfer family protein, partial [Thermomicrobiales bacterium]